MFYSYQFYHKVYSFLSFISFDWIYNDIMCESLNENLCFISSAFLYLIWFVFWLFFGTLTTFSEILKRRKENIFISTFNSLVVWNSETLCKYWVIAINKLKFYFRKDKKDTLLFLTTIVCKMTKILLSFISTVFFAYFKFDLFK